jgi:hypothetical protein
VSINCSNSAIFLGLAKLAANETPVGSKKQPGALLTGVCALRVDERKMAQTEKSFHRRGSDGDAVRQDAQLIRIVPFAHLGKWSRAIVNQSHPNETARLNIGWPHCNTLVRIVW